MTLIACPQDKCAMHISKGTGASRMCPVCNECGAMSNVIEKDNCVNCWNCWKDEGFIRQGFPEFIHRLRESNAKKEKEVLIESR